MRVRKVVTRSGKRFRGKFPSSKLDGMVQWESLIERDAILLFEFHPLVLSYQEQPSKEVYYDDDGWQRVCYPDFLLRFVGSHELLVEVKPHRKLARPSVRLKLDQIARHFEQQGRPYRVLTEVEVRRQPLHDNLKLLRNAQQQCCNRRDLQEMATSIDKNQRHSLQSLSAKLGSESAALYLIACGALRTDLEQPISPESVVWSASNMEAGHGAFFI